ncbi:MAG: DUF3149 domain-containing protein [Comamonadaceae bacterium]|nr:DUF3149 domain-containing protein [Comamonadaceae bacterium]
MKMLTDLISTDYGLMSLIVILIVIAMWIYFTVLFMGKIDKSSAEAAKAAKTTAPSSART